MLQSFLKGAVDPVQCPILNVGKPPLQSRKAEIDT